MRTLGLYVTNELTLCTAKTQVTLGIPPASLAVCGELNVQLNKLQTLCWGPRPIYTVYFLHAHSKPSYQTVSMSRLLWVSQILLTVLSSILLTLCPREIFIRFSVVCWFFFKINFFRKIISRIRPECQTVWIQIRPDVLSGLICVQTLCKSYRQTTLGDEENQQAFARFLSFNP